MARTDNRDKWKQDHNNSRCPVNDNGTDTPSAYMSLRGDDSTDAFDKDASFNQAVRNMLEVNGVDTSGWYNGKHTFTTLYSKLVGYKNALYGHNGDAKNTTPTNLGAARGFPTAELLPYTNAVSADFFIQPRAINYDPNAGPTIQIDGEYMRWEYALLQFKGRLAHKMPYDITIGADIYNITAGGGIYFKQKTAGDCDEGNHILTRVTIPKGSDEFTIGIGRFLYSVMGGPQLDGTTISATIKLTHRYVDMYDGCNLKYSPNLPIYGFGSEGYLTYTQEGQQIDFSGNMSGGGDSGGGTGPTVPTKKRYKISDCTKVHEVQGDNGPSWEFTALTTETVFI